MPDFIREKSGGTFFKNDGKGPIMKGSFELVKEDLKELIDLVKAGETATFKLVMWDKKTSRAGNDFYPLSIDKWKKEDAPAPKKPEPSFFGGDDEPDDAIPF